MAVEYYPQSEWQLTNDQATPEQKYIPYGLGSKLVQRQTWTKVYERPMTAFSDIPASPVNPGNLATVPPGEPIYGYWQCIDRAASRQYGDNGPKMYHETWEKVEAWSDVEE